MVTCRARGNGGRKADIKMTYTGEVRSFHKDIVDVNVMAVLGSQGLSFSWGRMIVGKYVFNRKKKQEFGA